MLLELAIGDAYGAGFEYANRQLIAQFNDLSRYVKHPRHSIKPGRYTDDTQMTLAIAEAMVSGEDWTPANLARRFVEAFKRELVVRLLSGLCAILRLDFDTVYSRSTTGRGQHCGRTTPPGS